MELAFLNIGTQEMILIVIVILLLFGGKKLPELARGLGKGIREFKDASEGIKREISDQINNFEKDLEVKVDDTPSNASKSDTTSKQDGGDEVAKVEVEEGEVQEGEEKKAFPAFTVPDNTVQHDPGAHPADANEYYKYGYNDNFSTEEKSVDSQEVTPEQEGATEPDKKQDTSRNA